MTCFHPESDECISSCENLLEWKSLRLFVVHEFFLNLFRKIIPENFVHEFSNVWIAFSRSFLCNIIVQIMHLLVEKQFSFSMSRYRRICSSKVMRTPFKLSMGVVMKFFKLVLRRQFGIAFLARLHSE